MAELKNLKDLYIDELRDLFNAESQMCDALPTVIDKANNSELKQALKDHLQETKNHRDKVKSVLNRHDKNAGGEKCHAMEGLINETEHMLSKDMTPEVCDAAIIACAQRIEHYEMAGYGTVKAYAKALKMDDDLSELSTIFKQEEGADSKLNQIALDTVNRAAMDRSATAARA